jgi:hypothetical protein
MGMMLSLPFFIVGTLIFAWLHKLGFKHILKVENDKVPGLFKRFTIICIASVASTALGYFVFSSLAYSSFALAIALLLVVLTASYAGFAILLTSMWCAFSYKDALKSFGFVFVIVFISFVIPVTYMTYKMGQPAAGNSDATNEIAKANKDLATATKQLEALSNQSQTIINPNAAITQPTETAAFEGKDANLYEEYHSIICKIAKGSTTPNDIARQGEIQNKFDLYSQQHLENMTKAMDQSTCK